MYKYSLVLGILLVCVVVNQVSAQVIERKRPQEWEHLVKGGRFMDFFLPMPEGKLSKAVWGAGSVLPRYVDNGIEDAERSYWGGNILRGEDGKYHLFVCGWPESSQKGHMQWPNSIVYHAVCDNSIGPFIIRDTIGAGHNPEAFRIKDGKCAIYVIGGYYLSEGLNGPWTRHKFEFNPRDRKIIEGLSNLTFAQREDGSYLMVCRGGGVWISRTGLSPYNQLTDKSIYPPVAGEFEDPVVWRDHIQYHLIVNDWLGRIAYYLRSKDGIRWVTEPGEAYMPGISCHRDGMEEKWFKYERIKIFQDGYGRAIQANFAVIDTLKNLDRGNDNHSSKNISIPLNPGVLMTMLNHDPITEKTKTIRIKIAAEEGFDPHHDIDVPSLRFGASPEVNFGRGCRVMDTRKEGKDLIVIFDGKGNGITPDEFAPKLLGRTTEGKVLYGYVRLPWCDYTSPLLSACKPVFAASAGREEMKVEVQNFGQAASKVAVMDLEYWDQAEKVKVGTAKIPALEAYEKVEVILPCNKMFRQGVIYKLIITIRTKDRIESSFDFSATPLKS